MNSLFSALTRALGSLFDPKMLALVLWPMLASVVIWVAAAIFFWADWAAHLTQLIQSTPVEQWMATGALVVAFHYLVTLILILLLVPAIYVTALVITAVFVMPMMVSCVADKDYPDLQKKRGGSNAGSLLNGVTAVFVYCAAWILSLPLWLFFPFAIVLPVFLFAYLNQRLFRYDALAEHASADEYRQIIERASGRLYLLGGMTGLLQFVPVLNLFSPVYIGLAFIHLCLAELQQLRQEDAAPGG
ncbi:MAG: EI24 domain-containing protein [Gallionella sp.]|nr:EI24 domain-containing protein [Gallionella sp.]